MNENDLEYYNNHLAYQMIKDYYSGVSILEIMNRYKVSEEYLVKCIKIADDGLKSIVFPTMQHFKNHTHIPISEC